MTNKEDPLRIELFSDTENRLIVRNNLLIRENSIESISIGLRNINTRYKILNHKAPSFLKDADFFSVIIPLIPSRDLIPASNPYRTVDKATIITD